MPDVGCQMSDGPPRKRIIELLLVMALVFLSHGGQLLRQNDWVNAAKEFRTALSLDEHSPDALAGLYEALLRGEKNRGEIIKTLVENKIREVI